MSDVVRVCMKKDQRTTRLVSVELDVDRPDLLRGDGGLRLVRHVIGVLGVHQMTALGQEWRDACWYDVHADGDIALVFLTDDDDYANRLSHALADLAPTLETAYGKLRVVALYAWPIGEIERHVPIDLDRFREEREREKNAAYLPYSDEPPVVADE